MHQQSLAHTVLPHIYTLIIHSLYIFAVSDACIVLLSQTYDDNVDEQTNEVYMLRQYKERASVARNRYGIKRCCKHWHAGAHLSRRALERVCCARCANVVCVCVLESKVAGERCQRKQNRKFLFIKYFCVGMPLINTFTQQIYCIFIFGFRSFSVVACCFRYFLLVTKCANKTHLHIA